MISVPPNATGTASTSDVSTSCVNLCHSVVIFGEHEMADLRDPKRTFAAGELVVTDRVAAAQEPTFQYREGPARLEGDVHDSEEKNGNFELISDFMGFHWVLDEIWKFILPLGLYLGLF